jgi:3-oxoadipate enol-lactonase
VLGFVTMSLATVSDQTVPAGRALELPGRGTTFVIDVAGPPGAPTIFLIHGLIATSYLNWFPAFEALAAHFRVIAMDLRGHGRGIPLSRRRFRIADCADDVAAVADALGIDRFTPVGYSLGGPIAQMVWRRHPERVEGMVLCATSRNFMGTPQERLFFQSLVGVAQAAQLTGVLPWVRPDRPPQAPWVSQAGARMSTFALGELRRTSPTTVLQALSAVGRFSSHEWVTTIDIPTAVVVTAKDRAIGPHRQIKLANAIAGSTIHPIKAGHAACALSSEFAPALVEACLSVSRRIDRDRRVAG